MIKILSQNLINQIAAGEVVERPASVIKELTENSIDARASEIEIKILDAGKGLISVSDNGCGMDRESLQLCVLSHATSKLSSENLFDIHTFGFRGEALPSMLSVARVSITSSDNDSGEAWCINSEGQGPEIVAASRARGTTVVVRDLFFATPARLKFLKSDVTESELCVSVVNRTALAFKNVSFRFWDKGKQKFFYKATDDMSQRVRDIFGEEIFENLFEVKTQKEGYSIHGFVGVPTFNKSSTAHQYFFVNNRFVKDKAFAYALKAAYSGLIPSGRFPVAILFLEMPYNEVDVNAHPAKTEVRFRESERIRNFLTTELKKAISFFGSSRPTTESVNVFCKTKDSSDDFAYSFSKEPANDFSDVVRERESPANDERILKNGTYFADDVQNFVNDRVGVTQSVQHLAENDDSIYEISRHSQLSEQHCESPSERKFECELLQRFEEGHTDKSPGSTESNSETMHKINLGTAVCQIANTYIVAASQNELIIVDQHAAAERITLEKLKTHNKLDPQELLMPEICSMSETQAELFEKNADLIGRFGLVFERLSNNEVIVYALPALLGSCEVRLLISDIAEELEHFGNIYSLDEKIHLILSTISCHGSLRAGRKLSTEEMNSLLRQMENTKNIAQCCHGRPSYITVSTKILNKFFERT